jgi:anti-sigma B factor antagonist
MNHSVTDHDNAIVVAFTGDVDLETSPSAREVLLGLVGGGRAILIDLSGVDYIDSSGVASLVEALQETRKAGTALGLVAVSEAAMRVLKLARLDTVFAMYGNVEEGLADVG